MAISPQSFDMAEEERIDIVDEQCRLTGVTKTFSEVHREGLLHHCAHVWVYTPDKKILFQYRSKHKQLAPSVWDTGAAGHISAGETPLQAAMREGNEELGIKFIEKNLRFIEVLRQPKRIIRDGYYENEFQALYAYRLTESLDDIKLDPKEVGAVQLLSVDTFLNELQKIDFEDRFVQRLYYSRMAQWVKNLD